MICRILDRTHLFVWSNQHEIDRRPLQQQQQQQTQKPRASKQPPPPTAARYPCTSVYCRSIRVETNKKVVTYVQHAYSTYIHACIVFSGDIMSTPPSRSPATNLRRGGGQKGRANQQTLHISINIRGSNDTVAIEPPIPIPSPPTPTSSEAE